MKTLKRPFAAGPGLCGPVLLSLAATAPQAQERRNELGFQMSSGIRSADPRLLGIVFYRREFGSGWLYGGGIGAGELIRDTRALVYAMNMGYRFAPLADAPAVRPQIGLQLGTTFTLANSNTTSLQAFAGLAFNAAPRLSLHAELLAGRSKDRSLPSTGGPYRVVWSNTASARVGASILF